MIMLLILPIGIGVPVFSQERTHERVFTYIVMSDIKENYLYDCQVQT